MLRTEMRMPRLEMSFKGFTLNDVMPSSAKEIIFFKGYLDSPAKRSARTAHQAVIGVIEDDVYAENLHEFIKALCSGALEERIGLALVAHAVDDVAALHIFFDKAVDDVNVILQVGIHADGAHRESLQHIRR